MNDITIEFLYKKAVYVSPYTGVSVPINIKQVKGYGNNWIEIISDAGVSYNKYELTEFSF